MNDHIYWFIMKRNLNMELNPLSKVFFFLLTNK